MVIIQFSIKSLKRVIYFIQVIAWAVLQAIYIYSLPCFLQTISNFDILDNMNVIQYYLLKGRISP